MKGKTLLCLALVASMLLSVFMVGPVGAQSTTIGVEPVDTIDPGLGIGSNFTVEVWIRDVEDLVGTDFDLGYNTTVLDATSITYGGIFGTNYWPLWSEIDDAQGVVKYSIQEAFGEASFNGSGRVAIINFTVDLYGESVLDLHLTKLADSPGSPIAHTIIDGFFSNVHIFLHAEAGLINISDPEGTRWHELYPTYSNRYNLTFWADMDNGDDLTYCDYIQLKNLTAGATVEWYHVYKVTVTINTTYADPRTATNSPSSTSSPSTAWTNPTFAYSSDDSYADSATADAEQEYGTYGFSIPSGSTITGVEVGTEAYRPAGNEQIGITCSWDGGGVGGSWATEQLYDPPAADPGAVTWFDFTGARSWTYSDFSDANFRAKVRLNEVSGGGTKNIYLDWIPVRVNYTAYLPMNIEFDDPTRRVYIQDFDWSNPLYTMWHEIRPVFSRRWNLTGWTDNSPSNLTVGDDIQLNGTTYHVDGISTDIIVKKLPSTPPIPEFPLEIALPIALIVAVVYVWWIKKPKRNARQQKPTSTISNSH